jgi:hypothetical protein
LAHLLQYPPWRGQPDYADPELRNAIACSAVQCTITHIPNTA